MSVLLGKAITHIVSSEVSLCPFYLKERTLSFVLFLIDGSHICELVQDKLPVSFVQSSIPEVIGLVLNESTF